MPPWNIKQSAKPNLGYVARLYSSVAPKFCVILRNVYLEDILKDIKYYMAISPFYDRFILYRDINITPRQKIWESDILPTADEIYDVL